EQAAAVNVLGTRNVLEAAARYGVDRLVVISTDKAVNPTSVMGASKRVAELLTQALSDRTGLNACAVRFGNVLGSRGSVVPTFARQIEAGGPVTVTDPEITRYFMTIPEAVSLIVQAGAFARPGEIYLLDMGEEMRIRDLAEKMIRFRGLRVDQDIRIVYTGLRPGEKLTEELLTNYERLTPTVHPKIQAIRSAQLPARESLLRQVEVLEKAVRAGDSELVRDRLRRLVQIGSLARTSGLSLVE
ncbi:MAG TPA: polysaccharide biosynthesis protein, partial [Dehalococcoidia bacterium]|nr:polysaccharide biosynthesis protein [Dehalococcoidia bacterium]